MMRTINDIYEIISDILICLLQFLKASFLVRFVQLWCCDFPQFYFLAADLLMSTKLYIVKEAFY